MCHGDDGGDKRVGEGGNGSVKVVEEVEVVIVVVTPLLLVMMF